MARAAKDRVTRLTIVLACLLVPVWGGATSLKDVKIGIHVIDFITNAPAGRFGIGIVYDPRVKESSEDAQLILGSLSSSIPNTRQTFKPILIDIRDIETNPNLRAVMVAERMKPYYETLADFGRRTRTLVISSDLDCARAGKCTVGIASTPRVEVIVSSQQAQASSIQFSEAFRMMVTEY